MKKLNLFLVFALQLLIVTSLVGQTTKYGQDALANDNGQENSAFGFEAMFTNDVGSYNCSFGFHNLRSNEEGNNNSTLGYQSLFSNIVGNDNTAFGFLSLYNNTASGNTAFGSEALFNNTTGYYNVATGYQALYSNTTGRRNIALGYFSLYSNEEGQDNIAIGDHSLSNAVESSDNIAIGSYALSNDSSSIANIAIGSSALYSNTKSSGNVAIGFGSLEDNTTGAENIGLGVGTLSANINGDNNIAIGFNASNTYANLFNSIAIGYFTQNTASNQTRIGNSSMTSIGGQVGWTTLSDGRFKTEVKQDVLGLKFINLLNPVSYQVDLNAFDEFLGVSVDMDKTREVDLVNHTGFIAQEVEATANKLGFSSFSGVDKPKNSHDYYGIRYSEFVVPLVKAVQELSAIIEEQQKQIDELKLARGIQLNSTEISSESIELYQNAPNPFNEETRITMLLPESAIDVQIIIYNLQGTQISSYEIHERGNASLLIKGEELKSGMYIYTLIVDNKVISTKRMILTK